MVMRWVESELRTSQDPKDLELADRIADRLKEKEGKDIPITVNNLPDLTDLSTFQAEHLQMMIGLSRGETVRDISDCMEREKRMRKLYKESPHTPELLTHVWQEIHVDISKALELEYSVEPCRASAEVIQTLEQQGRMAIYVPRQIYEHGKGWIWFTNDSLYKQQHRDSDWLKGFRDEFKPYGWLHTESAVSAPYPNTTEQQLRLLFHRAGLLPMGLNSYVITSHFLTFMYREALDKTFTHSRVLSSRVNGQAMALGYTNDWTLEYLMGSDPKYKAPNLGGRSVGTLDETTVVPVGLAESGESEEFLPTIKEDTEQTPFHFDPIMHKLPEDLPEQFGPWLEAFRERLGMSKTELGKRSGVTSNYISILVTKAERRPSLALISRISTVLYLNQEESEHLLTLAGYPVKTK